MILVAWKHQAVVPAWFLFSITLIIINKDLLSSWFPFPALLMAIHMGTASTVIWIIKAVGNIQVRRPTSKEFLVRILPLSLLYAISMFCSSYAYTNLSVSVLHMTKPWSGAAIVISFWAIGNKLDFFEGFLLCCIAIGVALSIYTEPLLVIQSMAFQLIHLTVEGIKQVFGMKLAKEQGSTFELLCYIFPTATLIFCNLAILDGEFFMVGNLGFRPLPLVCSALVASCLNFVNAFPSSEPRYETQNFLRDSLLIILSKIYLYDIFTIWQTVGYSISSICVYSMFQYRVTSSTLAKIIYHHANKFIDPQINSSDYPLASQQVMDRENASNSHAPSTLLYHHHHHDASVFQPIKINVKNYLAKLVVKDLLFIGALAALFVFGLFNHSPVHSVPNTNLMAQLSMKTSYNFDTTDKIELKSLRIAILATTKLHHRIAHSRMSWWKPELDSIVTVYSDSGVDHIYNIPSLVDTKCSADYKNVSGVWCKMTYIMNEWRSNMEFENAKWFVIANDDSYFHIENLLWLLQKYDETNSFAIGFKWCDFGRHFIMHGGPGTILSKAYIQSVNDAVWNQALKNYHLAKGDENTHGDGGLGHVSELIRANQIHYPGFLAYPIHKPYDEVIAFIQKFANNSRPWPLNIRPVAYHQSETELMPYLHIQLHYVNFSYVSKELINIPIGHECHCSTHYDALTGCSYLPRGECDLGPMTYRFPLKCWDSSLRKFN